MDKDIKDKWIAALRSEKFKQGKGKLRDGNDNYCCLGVLCDIMDADFRFNEGSNRYEIDGFACVPPLIFNAKCAISVNEMYHLMDMNDKEGKSFAEIAAYIEEKL